MKKFLYASFFLCYALKAENCASFETAQQKILSYKSGEALDVLECRIKENPNDFDSMLMLADILWRENRTEESRKWGDMLLEKATLDLASYYRLSDRRNRFRSNVSGALLSSDNNSQIDASAVINWNYKDKNWLGAGWQQRNKKFTGASNLKDESIEVNSQFAFGKFSYLKAAVSHSYTHEFSPEWTLEMEPHLLVGSRHDISLGLREDFYSSSSTFTAMPTWRIDFSDWWSLTARAYLSWSAASLFSPAATLSSAYAFSPRWMARISFGMGEVLESERVEDNFYDANLGITHRWSQSFLTTLSGGIHRGDLRDDEHGRLEVECRF